MSGGEPHAATLSDFLIVRRNELIESYGYPSERAYAQALQEWAEKQWARCPVFSPCGPHNESLGCGYERGHDGGHSWATLPTFVDGRTVLERAAIEFVQAEAAWADLAAVSGRMHDAKRPEDERRLDSRLDLIEEVKRATATE